MLKSQQALTWTYVDQVRWTTPLGLHELNFNWLRYRGLVSNEQKPMTWIKDDSRLKMSFGTSRPQWVNQTSKWDDSQHHTLMCIKNTVKTEFALKNIPISTPNVHQEYYEDRISTPKLSLLTHNASLMSILFQRNASKKLEWSTAHKNCSLFGFYSFILVILNLNSL